MNKKQRQAEGSLFLFAATWCQNEGCRECEVWRKMVYLGWCVCVHRTDDAVTLQ